MGRPAPTTKFVAAAATIPRHSRIRRFARDAFAFLQRVPRALSPQTIEKIQTHETMSPASFDRQEIKSILKPLTECQQCNPLSMDKKGLLARIRHDYVPNSLENSLAEALRVRSRRHQESKLSVKLSPHFFTVTDPVIHFEFMAVVITEFPDLFNCQKHRHCGLNYFRKIGWRPSAPEEIILEMFANAAMEYVQRYNYCGQQLVDKEEPELHRESVKFLVF
ncbi:hypothetical protein TWF970_010788 [Orbilia oligospora]|uniref:Uncharacterized protein n=1 Tax=Orbilia oligospora TaxID=2813651 RepID=A0A7C8V8W5_ORBOL|nr:hypothetical protein TWF970_010788 [Orbilia oligospora]